MLPLVEKTLRRTAPEDVDGQVGLRRTQAQILARRCEFEEAERVGRDAVERAARCDYVDLRADSSAALADVLSRAGRPGEASASLDEAVRLLERKGNLAGVALLRGVPVESLLETDRSR